MQPVPVSSNMSRLGPQNVHPSSSPLDHVSLVNPFPNRVEGLSDPSVLASVIASGNGGHSNEYSQLQLSQLLNDKKSSPMVGVNSFPVSNHQLSSHQNIVNQSNSGTNSSTSSAHPCTNPIVESTVSNNLILYHSLVYMAEQFRTRNPPHIRMSIHCLKSILQLKIPLAYLARTNLQLGRLIWQYSPTTPSFLDPNASTSTFTNRNDEQIRQFLERARHLGLNLRAPDDTIKFEAIDLLADFYDKRGRRDETYVTLNEGMSLSRNNPYWHCRFLFRRAQTHVVDRDCVSACECLEMGSEFARTHHSEYTRGLFLLSKCMIHLYNHQLNDFHASVKDVKDTIGSMGAQSTLTDYQREALQIFALIVDLFQYLMEGRAQSGRDSLRHLHSRLTEFAAMNESAVGPGTSTREIDHFQWLPREQLIALVYLVTVIHSMQSGFMERADRYIVKALHQIEKFYFLEPAPLFIIMQMSLLEHLICCHLITGRKTQAIQQLSRLIHQTSSYYQTYFTNFGSEQVHPPLDSRSVNGHTISAASNGTNFLMTRNSMNSVMPHPSSPQAVAQMMQLKRRLHCLLGLYAMSMNCMDQAANQFLLTKQLIANPTNQNRFSIAHQVTNSSKEPLYVFANLNLALVFLRQMKYEDSLAILQEVEHDLPDCCYGLTTAYHYVRGFHAMFSPDGAQTQYSEARYHLRECLRMSNEEDLTRMTATTLSTLGQVHLNLQDFEEGKKMIEPASQLASRIPDISVQLWSSALLKDIYGVYYRDKEKESFWFSQHDEHSQRVIADHMQATQLTETQWIEWLTDGLPPSPP